MTTSYAQFEQDGVPRDERIYDAATMLDRVAAFFRADGYTEDDYLDRCNESWERAIEDAHDAV